MATSIVSTRLDLQFHEIAGIFPLMSDDEFDGLVEDIRANGLRESVKLWQGKVIDGRNRYRACLMVGVKPLVQHMEFADENQAIAYVLSENQHRRHLSSSQLAMVAGRVREVYERAAKERQVEAGKNHGRGKVVATSPQPIDSGKSRDTAGKSVGVSGKSVDRATKVIKQGAPELQEAVSEGRVPVAVAAKLADLPKPIQRQAVSGGKPAIKAAIEDAKPKPKPTPIADVLFRAFRELLDRVDSIFEQFGTADKMLASPAWKACDTGMFEIVVGELADKFTKLNTEIKAYVEEYEA